MDNKALQCEERYVLSLYEVTHSLGVSSQTIIEIIDQGIVPVKKEKPEEWTFDREALQAIHKVLQLNKDLGVNIAGAALALELLEEIDRLHALLTRR